MYCRKCGNELSDNSAFCPKCGNRVTEKKDETEKKNLTIKHKRNWPKWVGVAVIACVMLLIVGGTFFIISNRKTYEDVVENYIESSMENNIEEIMDLIPEEILQDMVRTTGEDSIEAALNSLQRFITSTLSNIEEYSGSYSYHIRDVEDVKDSETIEEETIEELKKRYANFGIDISEVKKCIVDIDLMDSNGLPIQRMSIVIPGIKCDGKWYIEYVNIHFL